MTFNSFRQESWNNRGVETMTFNSFRQEFWNDRVVKTITFNSFRQREPGIKGVLKDNTN
ncbi:MAG: hypothetical protein H0A75_08885 [Candidatus Methanofishera endochildressiae]|uniref:Uncharacterized protein n=1 Tax=Candidatus Methanofishera endochildressiae TaxID=2738884 RepID=A0A7Z0SFP7_9GAMM|nr:hypothetical protein [Candidatus Methanofishera endochildressiae]